MTLILNVFLTSLAINGISGRLSFFPKLGRRAPKFQKNPLEWQGSQKLLPRKTTLSEKLKPNRKTLKYAGKVKERVHYSCI